jgi:hypothetical protein
MRPEKALQIVRGIRPKYRARHVRRPEPVVWADYRTATTWKWETATPHERACFVRENRRLGVMDWHLLDLFCLKREGLEAIVRGKDWHPSYQLDAPLHSP